MARIEFTKKELEEFKRHHFKFYNLNPHEAMTEDCVVRAIAAGENLSWEQVLKELTEYTLKYGDMFTTTPLYSIYLKDKGWKNINKGGMTVGELAKRINGSAIVSINNHLTYINKHYTMDIWDCTAQEVEQYWIKD